MSFSIWPMTFRHIRSTALALIPVGIDLASGRWVASISMMPEGGPALGQVGADGLGLPAVLRVLEQDLALVDVDRDRVQAEARVRGQLGRDFVLRAPVRGLAAMLADDLGPAAHFGPQLAQVGHQVVHVFGLVAGPVAVRDRAQRGRSPVPFRS